MPNLYTSIRVNAITCKQVQIYAMYLYVGACMCICIYRYMYACIYLVINVRKYVCSCNYVYIHVPSFLVVSDFGCGINPFLRRQIMMESATQVEASSRATTRKSIAIVLHADCPAASSTKG